METPAPQTPPRKSGLWVAALAFLLLAGTTLAVMLYRDSAKEKEDAAVNSNGFDFNSIPSGNPANNSARPNTAASPYQSQSGLGMIKGTLGPTPGAPTPNGTGQAEASLTSMCRANESWVQNIAMQYTKRYPVIAQFGREWMRYPDLKRLNDGYMLHHDPIAFLRGAAASPNFAMMLKKYASQPEIQSFVKDVAARAPKDAMGVAMDYLKDNKNVAGLVNSVAQSLGLPAGLINLSGASPQIDQNAVINNLLQNNPQLQNQQ